MMLILLSKKTQKKFLFFAGRQISNTRQWNSIIINNSYFLKSELFWLIQKDPERQRKILKDESVNCWRVRELVLATAPIGAWHSPLERARNVSTHFLRTGSNLMTFSLFFIKYDRKAVFQSSYRIILKVTFIKTFRQVWFNWDTF